MKIYADVPGRRAGQVITDVAVLVWVVVWAELGRMVWQAVHRLGASGRELQHAGNGLSGSLNDAAGQAGKVPLVGSSLRGPLRGAADAAAQAAHAGVVEQSAVGRAAILLGLVVALMPITLLAIIWLPRRLRWIRTATAMSRARDLLDDDLLALRALAHRALWELQRVHPRVGAAYASGDPAVVAALAQLELDDLGLRRQRG